MLLELRIGAALLLDLLDARTPSERSDRTCSSKEVRSQRSHLEVSAMS